MLNGKRGSSSSALSLFARRLLLFLNIVSSLRFLLFILEFEIRDEVWAENNLDNGGGSGRTNLLVVLEKGKFDGVFSFVELFTNSNAGG